MFEYTLYYHCRLCYAVIPVTKTLEKPPGTLEEMVADDATKQFYIVHRCSTKDGVGIATLNGGTLQTVKKPHGS